jgi:S1-C subfamily serine protease
MLPYHFEEPPSKQPAPIPPRQGMSDQMRRLFRRIPAALLLALVLAVGVGAGTVGTLAVGQWLTTEQPATWTTVLNTSAQTIQNNPQAQVPPAANNIAGAVYSNASPSVVRVIASGQVRNGLVPEGGGSGFVVDSDNGLILTNYHIVAGASNVRIRFSTSEERDAEVLGTDRGNDLAVLRVDLPEGVSAIPLGDSDQVAVGDTVIAIGSPFGLDQTVTQGIISAVDRSWQVGGGPVQHGLIQTDAAINPGNSGGPLLNTAGEVIGITTLIESPIRGNVGIGFAVPVNIARDLLPELAAGAQREPVRLGIAAAQEEANVAQDGVTVDQIVSGSAADRAGLQPGDIITAINGNQVQDMSTLTEQLAAFQPGDTVTLTITRNGQQHQIDVTLQAWTAQFR